MTQEGKSLLLRDLCARLLYGVICTDNRHGASKVTEVDIVSEVIYLFDVDEYVEIKNCKPYLFPMSSMTEEEDKKRKQLGILCSINSNHEIIFDGLGNESADTQLKALDWLNAHHFDYRGLIQKGLALEAHEGMYNLNKK